MDDSLYGREGETYFYLRFRLDKCIPTPFCTVPYYLTPQHMLLENVFSVITSSDVHWSRNWSRFVRGSTVRYGTERYRTACDLTFLLYRTVCIVFFYLFQIWIIEYIFTAPYILIAIRLRTDVGVFI